MQSLNICEKIAHGDRDARLARCSLHAMGSENVGKARLGDASSESSRSMDVKIDPDRTLSLGTSYPTPFFRIMDGVRRMAEERNVVTDAKQWTSVDALVALYKEVNDGSPDPPMMMFRSAVGRVFPAPVRKRPGHLGLSAPSLPVVDFAKERQLLKNQVGEVNRKRADQDKRVEVLRAERTRMKEQRARSGVVAGMEEPAGPPASFRYMDEFLGLSSASDIIDAGLFPNAKELAESMSAYNAVRDYMLRRLGTEENTRAYFENGVLGTEDPSITVVVVGDGHTPRTAGLFAFRTSWRCVSIDPALRTSKGRPWKDILRLQEMPCRVQDAVVDISGEASRVVVIAWHAHVSVKEALACLSFDGKLWDVEDKDESARMRHRVGLVTCACCQWDPLQQCMPDGSAPDLEYDDDCVPSGRRTVRVWRFQNPSTLAG